MKSISLRFVGSGVCAGFFSLFTMPAAAGDVEFVAVLKGQQFHQTSEHVVALGEWRRWHESQEIQKSGSNARPSLAFMTFAIGNDPDSLIAGSVTPQGGLAIALTDDDRELVFEGLADTPLDLEAAWPDGTYAVSIESANDGVYQVELDLVGSAYPPVPQLTGHAALQAIDASVPTTITWQPMGGTTADFILLSIRTMTSDDGGDFVFETEGPGHPEALNGTSTQVIIPPGTLEPGRDYEAELLFARIVDVKETPTLAIAAYYKLTGFGIRTTALPGTPLGAGLLRAVPSDGKMVPQDTVIAFRFSHPMSTNPAHRVVNWQENGVPFSPAVTYHWTQGDTVLLCEFTDELPGGKRIDWALSGFRDAAGFVLEDTHNGWFTTRTGGGDSPPDLEFVGLLKAQYFLQENATPVATGLWRCMVDAETMAPNRLKSAGFSALAGTTSGPLHTDPWDGRHFETPGEFASMADLDRFYPNGGYLFDFDGIGDGAFAMTLDLGNADAYPAAPTVTNHTALQEIDPAAPFTVEWEALPGWVEDLDGLMPGDGVIGLEIYDAYGRFVFDGWEDGPTTAISQIIPAGTLSPGREYVVQLSFVRVTDVYDGELEVFGVAGFESITHVKIRTSGTPELPRVSITKDGLLAVVRAEAGLPRMIYVLEQSTDLATWQPMARFQVGDGGTPYIWEFHDWSAQFYPKNFYRLRETANFEPIMGYGY